LDFVQSAGRHRQRQRLIGALTTGVTTIRANCDRPPVCGRLSGSAALTVTPATLVSITLSPAIASTAAGTSEQFTATGTFSDETTQNLNTAVIWTSSNPAVASVSGSGLANTVRSGSATISATCGVASVCGSLFGTAALTVTPATLVSITITPAAASIPFAGTETLTAVGTYSDNSTQILTTTVTWASSDTSVALISNAHGSQGAVTGLHVGTSSIGASLGAITSSAVTLTVMARIESVLHSFANGSDGAGAAARLIQGTDGSFYGTTEYGGANGDGTVFSITATGFETVLWSFGAGSDGANPVARLVQGTDGNFYGTTFQGGTNGQGTVFKITPAGVETVLWSFGGIGDGQQPLAGLLLGTDGNFYGTTVAGGANNGGTVFEITAAGVETVCWSFGSGSDGVSPLAVLIQGTDGNFYGTTAIGGANNGGTVFKMTAPGVETVLWSFGGGGDGLNPYAGLMQATDANLYGTAYAGGANGAGTVFRVTPSGVETTLWSFGGGSDGQNPYAVLLQGADGNLYGTTFAGGAYTDGTIFQITLAGVEAVLWSFGGVGDGKDPTAGLIQGSDGNWYGTTFVGGTNDVGTVFKF